MNPAAGGHHLDTIRVALAARSDVTVVEPLTALDAIGVARDAFAQSHGVVAVGGDGTFGMLTGPAADAKGLLALVPNGTGNDMARELGLNAKRPLDALALLDTGRVAVIDAGTITAADGSVTWFPSVASIGFDAIANERANTLQRVPSRARYVAAALATMKDFRPIAFELELDDNRKETRWAWLVAAANASTYGGGMRIAPDAQVADGALDLVTVGPVSRPQLLIQLPRVFFGKHVHHPSITIRRVQRVRVAPRCGTALRCYASGDDAGPTPVDIACVQGALRVIVPASHPLAGDTMATGEPVTP